MMCPCRFIRCHCVGPCLVEVSHSTSCWPICVRPMKNHCVIRCRARLVLDHRGQPPFQAPTSRSSVPPTTSLCLRLQSPPHRIPAPMCHCRRTWNRLHRHGNVPRRHRRPSCHGDRHGKHGVLFYVPLGFFEFLRRHVLHLRLTIMQLKGV